MDFVRLLNTKHFDPKRGKFTSLAFKNSTGGGASVISTHCVAQSGIPICSHIDAYYPERITGRPPIFWDFPASILPIGWDLQQQTSETGDVCHHNIIGVSDRQLRSLLGSAVLSDFSICASDGVRSARPSDVEPVVGIQT